MTGDPLPTDRSDTTIAHEVLSAAWAVIFVSAVRSVSTVTWPFSPQLKSFLAQNEQLVNEMISLSCGVCQIPPDHQNIFEDWKRNADENFDEPIGVSAWLSLYANQLAPPWFDMSDDHLLSRVTQYGLDCQIVNYIHALVLAAAERRSADPHALRELPGAVNGLLKITDRQAEIKSASMQSYKTWRVARLGDLLNPGGPATEEARDSIRSSVEVLDSLFGLNRN